MAGKQAFGAGAGFGGKGSFGGKQSLRVPYKNPSEDPLLNVEETDSLEAEDAAEMKALHEAMLETRKAVDRQVSHAIDGSFYITAVFLTYEDVEQFLINSNLQYGVIRDAFVDGYELARNLGMDNIKPPKKP